MTLTRRGFLSLLTAAPFLPALAKLAPPPLLSQTVEKLASQDFQIVRYMMSARSDLILPGHIGQILISPDRPFRPDRIYITPESELFDILNIGTDGELILENPIPAAFFAPTGYGHHVEFSTVSPADEIAFAVINRGGEAAHFHAVLMGNGLEARS